MSHHDHGAMTSSMPEPNMSMGNHGAHGGGHSSEENLLYSSDIVHESGNGGGGVHHGMKMYFHFGLGDLLFFQGWTLDTCWLTALACLTFYILATGYEGLKCYREHLLKKADGLHCYPVSVIGGQAANNGGQRTGDHGSNENGLIASSSTPFNSNSIRTQASMRAKMLNWDHAVQSLLHVLQVALSYTLMLGFMTFNLWLCLAILCGAGSGYFLFCWRKYTHVDVMEHCH